MNEADVRTMFRDLAETQAPPAGVDIRRAMVQARRNRMRRRVAGAVGSVLAAGAAVAIFALVIAPMPQGMSVSAADRATSGGVPRSSPSIPDAVQSGLALSTPPHPFNPLVPFASFGWLPKGYTTGLPAQATTSGDSTALTANSTPSSADRGTFWLHVMAVGACDDGGSVVVCTWDSGDGTGPLPLNHRAPDVDGRPAYWTDGDSMIWEYATHAWATMVGPGGYNTTPSASSRALMLKVADRVRYGDRTPLRFPFWVSGIPASWQVSAAAFTESPAVLLAQSLSIGPAADPTAASIGVSAANTGPGCQFIPRQSRYVTVDGVKGIMQANAYYQQLCVSNVNGETLQVSLKLGNSGTGAAVPGVTAIGGVLGIVKHLHLLGPDQGAWTTSPLR